MSRYDIIHEELQDRVDCGMLTLEDAQLIDNIAYEKHELTNRDYDSKMKECSDNVKYLSNQCRINITNGNFEEARECVRDIKHEINDMKSFLNWFTSDPDSILDYTPHRAIEVANNAMKTMIPVKKVGQALATAGAVGAIGIKMSSSGKLRLPSGKYDGNGRNDGDYNVLKIASATAVAVGAALVTRELSTSLKRIKSRGKVSVDDLNLYKNQLYRTLVRMEKNTDKALRTINETEAKYKASL